MRLLPGLVRLGLSLRYKVEIEGEELLKKYRDRSCLILANHPATIDPVIVLSFLEPTLQLQPLAADKFFKSPFIAYFLKKIGAMPVPEFETGNNEYKAYKVEKLESALKEALSKKAHILLYPAGHIADSPRERIGGASLAFELRQSSQKLLGVAIDGLYGSLFSRYFEKRTLPFMEALGQGIKIALKNGLFFLPKRTVRLRIFEFSPSIQKMDNKALFNAAIEEGLNKHLHQKISVVSYGWVKPPNLKEISTNDGEDLPLEMQQALIQVAEKVTGKKIGLVEHLSYDAGVDSLEMAEILTRLEQKYQKRIDEAPSTLAELGLLLIKQGPAQPQSEKKGFVPRAETLEPKLLSERHLIAAFLKQVQAHPFAMAAFDQSIGSISYFKALMVTRLLTAKIRRLEGSHVGIMLPASILSYLLLIATLMAGKIPVMLNWTGGRKAMDQAVASVNLKVIISSEKFLERAFNIDLGPHFDRVVLIESLKGQIGLIDKFRALYESLFPKGWSMLIETQSAESPAVVLFTSGSEAMPKGVSLSHVNILYNIKASLQTGLIHPQDRFLATLPPFHSFGCVVSGLLPLLTGLEVVYYPDPTDVLGIIQTMRSFKCTLFCTAPSFLKQILLHSSSEDLKTLRLAVVGAEKCPDSLKHLFRQMCLKGCLLEGYGITECSPIVTLQRTPLAKGVGTPLEGLELLVVDPESLTPLPLGEDGEILVRGKSVFKGYLGASKDPFVEISGKTWYRTGDRGSLTSHQELILKGRFKRFVKISAEMISLSALEEALESYRPSQDGLAHFAIFGDGASEKLTLITTYTDLDVDEIHHFFRKEGMPKVAKIGRIQIVQAIPQLASGKIDYRSLEHENI